MTLLTIDRIEYAVVEATRPRYAGSNARLGDHGLTIRVPLVRITTTDGSSGFGLSRASREQLEQLPGTTFEDLFITTAGVPEWLRHVEFPLLDLLGNRAQKPVYRLLRETAESLRVPCYDTTLYFDDLHIADDAEAVALLASEAQSGVENGHTNFKIKVGRGARHMELEQGTRRDIAIIQAVRDVAGPEGAIMIDANNGWNLNITKRVLAETANARLYWLEEAFHEDSVLYTDLREWMTNEGITTLIADGEGQASPSLMQWAADGTVDVVQYDIINPGFSAWLQIGARLDAAEAKSAPHHYGTMYGNFVTCHLAPYIEGFQFAEWDPADTPVIDTSSYSIASGFVTVPDAPGFGLRLDEQEFQAAVAAIGFASARNLRTAGAGRTTRTP